MSKVHFIVVCLVLCIKTTVAQQVTILDKTTFKPIEGVNIHKIKLSEGISSDGNGKADLSGFGESDSLRISSIGYNSAIFTKKQMISINKILLVPVSNDLGEVVVSASKFIEKKADVAHQVEVIKAKDIEIMSQPTTAELLQQTGQVMVQKNK